MLYVIGTLSLLSGGLIELFFHVIERFCVNVYARSKGSSVVLLRIPITVSYYLKLPIIILAIVYVSQILLLTYTWKNMFVFYCLFSIGMYVVSEYVRDS